VGGSPFLWELPFLLGRLPKEKVAKGFPPAFSQKAAGGKISQGCNGKKESK